MTAQVETKVSKFKDRLAKLEQQQAKINLEKQQLTIQKEVYQVMILHEGKSITKRLASLGSTLSKVKAEELRLQEMFSSL